jgi:hypothetical protein
VNATETETEAEIECASDEEIEAYIASHQIVMRYGINYVDFDDFENPVKGLVEEKLINLSTELAFNIRTKLTVDKFQSQDSVFGNMFSIGQKEEMFAARLELNTDLMGNDE